MTSDELHEDADWEPWNQNELAFLIAVVKAVLREVYVKPKEDEDILKRTLQLKEDRTPEDDN